MHTCVVSLQTFFKKELGCLKVVEQEVRFKQKATSKFCKPRPVPFVIPDDLAQAYDA